MPDTWNDLRLFTYVNHCGDDLQERWERVAGHNTQIRLTGQSNDHQLAEIRQDQEMLLDRIQEMVSAVLMQANGKATIRRVDRGGPPSPAGVQGPVGENLTSYCWKISDKITVRQCRASLQVRDIEESGEVTGDHILAMREDQYLVLIHLLNLGELFTHELSSRRPEEARQGRLLLVGYVWHVRQEIGEMLEETSTEISAITRTQEVTAAQIGTLRLTQERILNLCTNLVRLALDDWAGPTPPTSAIGVAEITEESLTPYSPKASFSQALQVWRRRFKVIFYYLRG